MSKGTWFLAILLLKLWLLAMVGHPLTDGRIRPEIRRHGNFTSAASESWKRQRRRLRPLSDGVEVVFDEQTFFEVLQRNENVELVSAVVFRSIFLNAQHFFKSKLKKLFKNFFFISDFCFYFS
jgi:hypothetical protein